ncbi:MAG: bifunctional phosphoserine phosphatase/homoserine phosphotransferase ThrH [Clostridia bacterium]|nr:bifunctional phosphoserine phosphatase/homoserine phosphotransferase ThrH [Clostridia bacterium]
MDLVCLDMEGVLTPEIWIEFSRVSGIPELKRTTRDEPDYRKLMYWRMVILKDHGLGLKEIQAVIERIDPLPGARAFLDALRDRAQVVILSDTFAEFAKPLLEKLGRPTIFCNSLAVSPAGELTDIRMRCKDSKLSTVRALQSVGFETIAVGDSYNDIDMLLVSKAGFLFRTTDKIKATYPQLPAFTAYDDLLAAITEVLE